MGRVVFKTLCLYLAVICFIYIDCILPVTVFKNVLLYYILDRVTSLNPNLKEATLKLPILYSILAKIATSSNLILGVNTNAAFYLIFIEYLVKTFIKSGRCQPIRLSNKGRKYRISNGLGIKPLY